MDLGDLKNEQNHEATDDLSEYEYEDQHPPLSPHNSAESFFISSDLRASNVSGFALAAQIRRKAGHSVSSGISAATDEFATAHDDDHDDAGHDFSFSNSNPSNLFGKDILVLTREPTIPEDNFDFHETMSQTEPVPSTPVPVLPTPEPEDTTKVHQLGKPNPTQNVYETVKDVWTWGKGVPVVGFVEDVTECVVNKAVGVVGTSLPEMDGVVKPQLAGLDNSFLNPAIDAVVGTVVAGADKGKDIVIPAVDTVLGVVGMGSKIEDNKMEQTFPPEISKPVAAK